MHESSDLPTSADTGPSLKADFLASIVVFLVALPLCLGIAIASGVPPTAGIVTGIIGGIIVGCLSGSPLQVSGPAAGLIVIVRDANDQFGAVTLGVIILFAGAIQLIAGLSRLGHWFRAVSPAVINGMLAGIGVLILASQFHVMVDDAPKGSGIANLISIPAAIEKIVAPELGTSHHIAAGLGILTIVVIVLWKMAPKRMQVVPGPLVAVIVATLVSVGFELAHYGVRCVDLPDDLVGSIRWPTPTDFHVVADWHIWVVIAELALVASAETLLCAAAVDQMQVAQRTKYDHELAAQGFGNMLCGLVGGLPMTGVIVRSAANVQAGARSRLSAIFHGFWLLLFVFAVPFAIEHIPTSSLAGVLVYTGYKLVNPASIRTLLEHGKIQVVIYFITLGVIVTFDLLTGIIVGIVLSLAKLLYTFSRLRIRLEDGRDGEKVLYLRGAATFIRLPILADILEALPPETKLRVNTERVTYIDHACQELLQNCEKRHSASGGSVEIDWNALLAKSDLTKR